MKHILAIALLLTIAFASLRGAERKENENKQNQQSSRSYSQYSQDDYSMEEYSQSNYSEDDYSSNSQNNYEESSENYSDDYSGSYSESQSYSNSYDDSDSDSNNDDHKPEDDFSRQVFDTLRKIEKKILREWRVASDIELKNVIREEQIQTFEELLPIVEESTESVNETEFIQHQNEDQKEQEHPPKPHPEDEFAKQVFETIHQIARSIFEEWSIENDVHAKNSIRATLVDQLSNLIPIAEQTTTIDNQTEVGN